jgi:hypothetical protein
VRVCPRASPSDAGEWRVEAHAGRRDAAVISQWGATRIEALREVGRVWGSSASAHGYPMFDWEAVAEALLAVRAI